jgi:hypothetical protein
MIRLFQLKQASIRDKAKNGDEAQTTTHESMAAISISQRYKPKMEMKLKPHQMKVWQQSQSYKNTHQKWR